MSMLASLVGCFVAVDVVIFGDVGLLGTTVGDGPPLALQYIWGPPLEMGHP